MEKHPARYALLTLGFILIFGTGCGQDSYFSQLSKTSQDSSGNPGENSGNNPNNPGDNGGVDHHDGNNDENNDDQDDSSEGSKGKISCRVYDLSRYFHEVGCEVPRNTSDLESNLKLPAVPLSHLETCGMKLPASFQGMKGRGNFKLEKIDVSPRSWELGFPGFPKSAAHLREWYGVSCEGKIKIKDNKKYTFKLLSDDGAKLLIDRKLVIDHDGVHAPSSKTGSIELEKGTHPFILKWYQGPRFKIALQLGTLNLETGKFEILTEDDFE